MKFLSFCTKTLHNLPAEISHWVALNSLNLLYLLGILDFLVPKREQSTQVGDDNFLDIEKYKHFKQRIGFAAGLDKNGDFIDSLASLGVSFIELGTVTPVAQKGNSRPRLIRDKKNYALVNKMGFNNKGVEYLVKKIKKRKSSIPLGISIGKNFNTPIENAYLDYLICLEKVYHYASYIAVNISSPNTKNLRTLSETVSFDFLLDKVKQKQIELAKNNKYKPLLVKVSPDEDVDQIHQICNSIKEHSIDGIICTNTSVDHNHKMQGGLSGRPLADRSTKVLALARDILGDNFLVIASGGVMSKEIYKEKLAAGADLVQIYTGFIYEGPKLIQDILEV